MKELPPCHDRRMATIARSASAIWIASFLGMRQDRLQTDMKTKLAALLLGLVFSIIATSRGQDENAGDPNDLADLSGLAERYVSAYNEKKLDDIVAMYTEEAELVDDIDGFIATGREEIQEIFAVSFETSPNRKLALDVLSVRKIAQGLVVEEGIARFSDEAGESEESSVFYSAILVKQADGPWLIASSREIDFAGGDDSETDPLADLYSLEGDWTLQSDGMTMDLSLYLSPNGRYLLGSALTSSPSDGEMETDIRIGFDASLGQIRWWTFDDLGGFAQGTWQPLEASWLVRTNGVTADGEPNSAIQELVFEDDDTIVWKSTHRFLSGLALPDAELRLVRRPPAPALTFFTDEDVSEESPPSDPTSKEAVETTTETPKP